MMMQGAIRLACHSIEKTSGSCLKLTPVSGGVGKAVQFRFVDAQEADRWLAMLQTHIEFQTNNPRAGLGK